MNHTPTPWHSADGNYIRDSAGWAVAKTYDYQPTPGLGGANADHIVRCVKAHHALVAALTKISNIPCNHGAQDECPREIARAALAKAKGE